MKNIDPKTYDNRFWRFTFMLLIQVLIIMGVAAGLVVFSEFNIVVMIAVLGGCGTFMVIIIYLSIAQITVMREQMRVELNKIYGVELEEEISEEFSEPVIDGVTEKTTVESEGGANIGGLFSSKYDDTEEEGEPEPKPKRKRKPKSKEVTETGKKTEPKPKQKPKEGVETGENSPTDN